MNTTMTLFCCTTALLLAACKKDEPAAPAPMPAPVYSISDFSRLEPGNYWIYQRYMLDSLGNTIGVIPQYDSVYVSGTSMMNGQQYTVLSRATGSSVQTEYRMLRDSADRLVEAEASTLFRYGVFDQVAWTTVDRGDFVLNWSVGGVQVPVQLPAGQLNAYLATADLTQIGSVAVPPASRAPRMWWTAGIGKVKEEYYFGSGNGVRYELVRYGSV